MQKSFQETVKSPENLRKNLNFVRILSKVDPKY